MSTHHFIRRMAGEDYYVKATSADLEEEVEPLKPQAEYTEESAQGSSE